MNNRIGLLKKLVGKWRAGFTIIEVMVVVAILSAIMAAFLTMFGNQVDSVGFLEDKMSRVSLNGDVTSVLMNSVKCTDMLAGTNVPIAGNGPTKLKDLAGNVLFNPASPPGKFDHLSIDAVYVTNVSVAAPLSTGVVNLTVELSRVRPGGGPSQLQPLKKNVTVDVDGARNIVSCVGLPYY